MNMFPVLAIVAVLSGLLVCVGCSPANDWGSVTVTESNGEFEVVLENDLILARYTPADTGGLIKDRITEFRLKKDNAVIATKLDGRHADKNTAFFRMSDAEIESETPDRKTVRLVFAQRIEHVSILRGLPVLEIRYEQGKHNLDYGIKGRKFVMYGEDEWQGLNKWEAKHPQLRDEVTEAGSYYRSNWFGPGPLSYNGWMILGVCSRRTGYGVGLLLPANQVRWLKLVGTGFERWMTGPHTAYLYACSGGPEQLLSLGKQLADTAPK